MDHIERFNATIERKPVDRPCSWLGIPDTAAYRNLFDYFGVNDVHELIICLDDDIVPVELPYHSPTADAVYAAFDFAQKGKIPREHRTLNAPGFFENITDPDRIEEFDWPDPAQYINPNECRAVVSDIPSGRAVLGVVWSAHFQDACAAFGLENAFIQLLNAPDMFRGIIQRILEFYITANDIFYTSVKDKLHAVLIGNDFGGQNGLLLSPDLIREFVLPGTRQLIEQAKAYDLKVIHHSCGSIRPLITDLIELGVDAIHPIQVLANGMDPLGLQKDFGHRVAFCGGVDAQYLLVKGTPDQVRDSVYALKEIFPTGLIISPSHEAILPDTPPQNIEAMFQTIRN